MLATCSSRSGSTCCSEGSGSACCSYKSGSACCSNRSTLNSASELNGWLYNSQKCQNFHHGQGGGSKQDGFQHLPFVYQRHYGLSHCLCLLSQQPLHISNADKQIKQISGTKHMFLLFSNKLQVPTERHK